jgi:hypothetical protein
MSESANERVFRRVIEEGFNRGVYIRGHAPTEQRAPSLAGDLSDRALTPR